VPTVDVPFGKVTANIIDKPVELGALRCSTLMPDACELALELLAELLESLATKVSVVALTVELHPNLTQDLHPILTHPI